MSCIAPPRRDFGAGTAGAAPFADARRRLPALAGAAALATACGPAWADLLAEEVWQGWRALAAESGQQLSAASAERDGDTLTARGVMLSGHGDGLGLMVELDEIAFKETSDGTVSVRMTDAYELVVQGDDGTRLRLAIRHPGLLLEVSETGAGLHHDLSAPEIAVQLAEFSGPEAPDQAALSLSALRVAAQYGVSRDALGTTTADMTAGALDFDMSLREEGDAIDLDYAATGLAMRFAGAGLDRGARIGMGDMGGALAAGFALDFALDHETQRYAIDSLEDGETVNIAGRSTNGRTRFVLDGAELAFHSESRNGELTMPAEALIPALAGGIGATGAPVVMPPGAIGPVTLRAGEVAYGVRLPTGGAPQAQDATALLRLVDITAPETVWAMLDPSGALPRMPVTAVLDLGAEAVLPDDLFGMGTMLGFMMGGAFEVVRPTALDIRELVLRFAGSELVGDGAFTLDATDLETFPGLPRPTGSLNLTLRGSEALIDTMVEAGLLPPDQANAARLLIALLGRPGDAPGELVSTIEIDETGAVLTNGMRLR